MLWTGDEKELISKETAYLAIQVHQYFLAEKLSEMQKIETREQRLQKKVIEKLWHLTVEQEKAYTTVSKLQQKTKDTNGLKTAKELEPFLQMLQDENKIEITAQAKNKRILYISPYLKNDPLIPLTR